MTIQPDITTPLVRDPIQQPNEDIGLLTYLQGTWNSPKGAEATGFNVMPLPQAGATGGYILKNFPYYEEITFAPIAGGAPNRGGTFTQNNNLLFYEQRVFIANNPAPANANSPQDTLIHAENGAWLYRSIVPQLNGPYGPDNLQHSGPLPVQPASRQYVKQTSVPHGNSLLLVGQAIESQGSPQFPQSDRKVLPFTDPTVKDPNTVLAEQLQGLADSGITVEQYIRFDLSTDPAIGGGISNVLFAQHHASVSSLKTTWYVEFLSNGSIQLQYTQTIGMNLLINGIMTPFLHVDANTLTKE